MPELEFSPRVVPEQLPRSDPRCLGVPVNIPVYAEPYHYWVSVQSFSRGGYEAVIKMVDAQQIAEQRCRPRRRGARIERPEAERDEAHVERASWRAKRQVRYRCKELGTDRLLTLTTREQASTPEQMLDRWQRWLALLERANLERFGYVAVLERHPSNPAHLHIHVAIAVYLPVNVLRQCWWQVCGGRGMGNVHVKRIGSGSAERRVCRVASYISKYLAKEMIVRFNKKRYWASRAGLPEVRRYWLKARSFRAALGEAVRLLDYVWDEVGDMWIDDGKAIAWLQAVPDCISEPPF